MLICSCIICSDSLRFSILSSFSPGHPLKLNNSFIKSVKHVQLESVKIALNIENGFTQIILMASF